MQNVCCQLPLCKHLMITLLNSKHLMITLLKKKLWSSQLLALQAFAERVMKAEQASKEPFKSSIENFYQTDAITRSSSVMAKCVQARKNMHVDTLSTAEMSSV